LTLREIVLELRRWLGLSSAPVLAIPMSAAQVAAWAGDLLRWSGGGGAISSTALTQLGRGNTADPGPFIAAVGFTPRRFRDALIAAPSHVQDHWHARLYLLRPLLRATVALFWIMTGLLAMRAALRPETPALAAAVLPERFALLALWTAAATDLALGALMLLRRRVILVGAAMIAVTFAYLALLTYGQPALWMDPLGPLTKTLPLVVATLVVMAVEDDR
jgi:hypothetical protein